MMDTGSIGGRKSFTRGLWAAAIVLVLCGLLSCGQGSPKFKKYYVHGEELYTKYCSNCHQKDGSGLGRIYPPLDTSDYMEDNFESVLCLIRNGISGEMVVNGKQYNQAMPGIPKLSDLEVAEIATYIYNTWSHQRGIVEVKEAAPILDKCPPMR